MSDVFGASYADAYDTLYGDKAYGVECDAIEKAFAAFGAAPMKRVLDLGCGTGGHAIPLAQRGYDVIGVDRSSGMLEIAQSKVDAAALTNHVTLIESEIASVPVIPPCDAALMMFAVLGYLTSDAEAAAALASVRKNLGAGALFLFDVWYAPAVLRHPPQQRWKIVEQEGARILRLSSTDHDPAARVCAVTFRVIRLVGERIVGDTIESHRMRYFDRSELESLLADAGFELLRLGGFPDYSREPEPNDWSVLVIARAV